MYCLDCRSTLISGKRPPFKKRYFYKLRFQGKWYICKFCKKFWTDRGLKKEKKRENHGKEK